MRAVGAGGVELAVAKAPFFARRRSAKLVNKAHAAYDRNDTAAAWRALEGALKDDSGNAEAEFMLGRIANDRGQHAIAVEHLERATSLAPANADAHGELGRALHELRRRDQAEAAYKRALEIRNDPYIAINYGTLMRDSGRFEEAAALFRRALESGKLDPDTRRRIEAQL